MEACTWANNCPDGVWTIVGGYSAPSRSSMGAVGSSHRIPNFSVANPKITASVKTRQKFTQTFMAGTPLYKITIVKGSGTTKSTHTVKVK
jgi:hypothetical protein